MTPATHPHHIAALHEPRAVPTGRLAATVLADALWRRAQDRPRPQEAGDRPRRHAPAAHAR